MKAVLPLIAGLMTLVMPFVVAEHEEDQTYNPGAVPIDVAGVDFGGSFFPFGGDENAAEITVTDALGLPVTVVACQNTNNNAQCEAQDGDLFAVGCGSVTINGLDPTLIDQTPGHEGGNTAQLQVKPDLFGNFFEADGCGTGAVPVTGQIHAHFFHLD